MKTKLAYCDRCNREVRVVWSEIPLHGGQAPLHDPELVCLDCGTACANAICSITNLSHVVMENRVEQLDKKP
ncbi:MAG: hypothetical protein WEE89_16585 [Gemmatimonadota bacterium]